MMFIKIDQHGDPVDYPVTHENIEYLLGDQEFTIENIYNLGFKLIKNFDVPENFDPTLKTATRAEIITNAQGDVEQLWNIEDITADEKIRRWILGPRQHKLIASDWTQAKDCPLSEEKISQWAEYRAQLRDMTETIDFSTINNPEEIIWPTPPGPIDPQDKWGMPSPELT